MNSPLWPTRKRKATYKKQHVLRNKWKFLCSPGILVKNFKVFPLMWIRFPLFFFPCKTLHFFFLEMGETWIQFKCVFKSFSVRTWQLNILVTLTHQECCISVFLGEKKHKILPLMWFSSYMLFCNRDLCFYSYFYWWVDQEIQEWPFAFFL